MKKLLIGLLLVGILIGACSQPTPEIIVVTVTPEPTAAPTQVPTPTEVVTYKVTVQIRSGLCYVLAFGKVDIYQIEWGKNENVSSHMVRGMGDLGDSGNQVRWSQTFDAQHGDVIKFSTTMHYDYTGKTTLLILVDGEEVASSFITGMGSATCQYELSEGEYREN